MRRATGGGEEAKAAEEVSPLSLPLCRLSLRLSRLASSLASSLSLSPTTLTGSLALSRWCLLIFFSCSFNCFVSKPIRHCTTTTTGGTPRCEPSRTITAGTSASAGTAPTCWWTTTSAGSCMCSGIVLFHGVCACVCSFCVYGTPPSLVQSGVVCAAALGVVCTLASRSTRCGDKSVCLNRRRC